MADEKRIAMEKLAQSYGAFEADFAAALQTFPFSVRIPLTAELLHVFSREAFKPDGEGALTLLLEVERADGDGENAPPESIFIGSKAELDQAIDQGAAAIDPYLGGMTEGQRATLQSFLDRLGSMAIHFGPDFDGGIRMAAMGIITLLCRSIGPYWLEGIAPLALSYYHPSHGEEIIERGMEHMDQPMTRQQRRAAERAGRKGRRP